jgi:quercetin dioxygenase-like cupin family protein
MRRRSLLATLVLILALVLPLGVAADDPPAPTTRFLFRVPGLPVAGLAEMVTFVNDFVPGAATPPHTHPGLLLATTLEGTLTFRTGGAEKTYRVGESFTERPGEVGTALNLTGARTQVAVSVLVPQGAAPSTPQPGGPSPAPPAPTTLYALRAQAFAPAESHDLAQTVLDFAPGAQTPVETHPGQVFVTVIAGEITFTADGATKVYTVGQSFVERPDVAGQARNAGSAQASVLETSILPTGAPLSTPVAMPVLPATGGGGGRDRLPVGWLVLGAGGALVVGGTLRRYRARRA